MGQGHLYMYLLGADDQWWKIQDHEATRVSPSLQLVRFAYASGGLVSGS